MKINLNKVAKSTLVVVSSVILFGLANLFADDATTLFGQSTPIPAGGGQYMRISNGTKSNLIIKLQAVQKGGAASTGKSYSPSVFNPIPAGQSATSDAIRDSGITNAICGVDGTTLLISIVGTPNSTTYKFNNGTNGAFSTTITLGNQKFTIAGLWSSGNGWAIQLNDSN